MRIEVITGRDIDETLWSTWEAIQASAPSELHNPFFHPGYVTAIGSIRDDVRIGVIEDGGRVVGFFPFELGRWNIARPAGLRLNDYQGVVINNDTEWDPIELIQALRPVAAGRHMLAYSTDPIEQEMWQALGVAGSVEGDEVGVALLNIGANKIDPFVAVEVDVVPERDENGDGLLTFSVTIENNTPAGLDPGITGYYWETLSLPTPASYLGRLTFMLPGSTIELDLADGDQRKIEVFGRDGPLAIMVVRLEPIPEGTTATIEATARLDGSTTPPILDLIPSARYIPISYQWGGEELVDDRSWALPIGD
jgi:hypothetical protein